MTLNYEGSHHQQKVSTKRYLLFCTEGWTPGGGMHDYVLGFDLFKVCISKLQSDRYRNLTDDRNSNSFHIFDTLTREVVWFRDAQYLMEFLNNNK